VSPSHRLTASSTLQNGFTLLELIISIAILGIIILIIAGATRLGFRSVDTGEKKIESLERLKTSLTIMESQILSEIPLTYDEDGSKKYYFKGSRDSLQFSTNSSLLSGQRGYVLASYRVVPDQNGKQVLYLSENSIGMENKTETKLLDGSDEIYFEYFYKDPTAEQGTWVKEYPDAATMPEKMTIHIVQGGRDLSMIIPMRTQSPLAQTPQPAQTPATQGIATPSTPRVSPAAPSRRTIPRRSPDE
jgi:general secretion pathway protein J